MKQEVSLWYELSYSKKIRKILLISKIHCFTMTRAFLLTTTDQARHLPSTSHVMSRPAFMLAAHFVDLFIFIIYLFIFLKQNAVYCDNSLLTLLLSGLCWARPILRGPVWGLVLLKRSSVGSRVLLGLRVARLFSAGPVLGRAQPTPGQRTSVVPV